MDPRMRELSKEFEANKINEKVYRDCLLARLSNCTKDQLLALATAIVDFDDSILERLEDET